MYTYGSIGRIRHGYYHKTCNDTICHCLSVRKRMASSFFRKPSVQATHSIQKNQHIAPAAKCAQTMPETCNEDMERTIEPVPVEVLPAQTVNERTESGGWHDDLKALPDAAELSDLFEYDLDTFPAEQLSLEKIADAVGRLTDTVARLIETAGINGIAAEPCGLLRFREWWELIEVVFLVGGKHVSGIPIYLEGDAVRVINQDNSYFIPLEKVEYIRTGDGLCPGKC